MVKSTLILISFCSVFFFSSLGFAGVAGSKHDMFFMGRGQDPNVCSYCHMPHKAAGDKIWSSFGNEAQLANGPSSPIGNMCYTCHDGTVTNRGQNTVFNAALQQHKTGQGSDCNICHTVHNNINEKFMNVAKKQNSYCAACHDAKVNAGNLGDFTGAGNHPSSWQARPLHNTGAPCVVCHDMRDMSKYKGCYLCHSRAHGAANYSTPTVANPILRSTNVESQFCSNCHPINVQRVDGGRKHPANLAAAGQWGKLDCETCHDPHQPNNPNNPAILRNPNINSKYCMACHSNDNEVDGPSIGHGHPVGVPFNIVPIAPGESPAADEIDDDDNGVLDYPENTHNVVCESCHSAHRKGVEAPLARMSINQGNFCRNCHHL